VRVSDRERYYEQLAFRNALCSYFEAIIIHDDKMHRRTNPSTPSRYMNERFKPVFFEVCKLVNDIESRQLHVRRLAKLMDEFSEMLISSASFTQKELSAFWAEGEHSGSTTQIDSLRLKRIGAKTLSVIVEHAAGSRQKPNRPRSGQSTSHGPQISATP
jgi:hypothetical protein